MRKAPDLKLPVASCALAHIHSHTLTHAAYTLLRTW